MPIPGHYWRAFYRLWGTDGPFFSTLSERRLFKGAPIFLDLVGGMRYRLRKNDIGELQTLSGAAIFEL
jgi:hypothetical protein